MPDELGLDEIPIALPDDDGLELFSVFLIPDDIASATNIISPGVDAVVTLLCGKGSTCSAAIAASLSNLFFSFASFLAAWAMGSLGFLPLFLGPVTPLVAAEEVGTGGCGAELISMERVGSSTADTERTSAGAFK